MGIIDSEAAREKIIRLLPIKVSWDMTYDGVDFDFSRAQRFLKPLQQDEISGGELDTSWEVLLLFGAANYCDGGGGQPVLGLHKLTGEVWAIDIEMDSMYFVSSDVDRFIESFLVLDAYFRLKILPKDQVEPMLRKIDPLVYDRSDWKSLWDYHGSEEER